MCEGKLYTSSIDFRIAFDVVDRNMLLYMIINCGVDGKLYFAIMQIYNMTKTSVRVNGELTDWLVIENGVRQGDTLSSTLFLLYINDLVKTLNGLDIGINIDVRKVCCLLYADVVVLVSESPCDLQRLQDALHMCTTGVVSGDLEQIMKSLMKIPKSFILGRKENPDLNA